VFYLGHWLVIVSCQMSCIDLQNISESLVTVLSSVSSNTIVMSQCLFDNNGCYHGGR